MPDPGPLRVLVVEDEPVNRALLRAVLNSAEGRLGPIELIEAGTVGDGRAAIAAQMPHIVVLDVRLPDGNGLEIARELSERSSGRPRVIVMSASVLPRDREVAVAAGTDGFLGKPFLPRELIDLLETLTDGPRAAEG
jgi:CheY-like chemotaxis protein